MFAMINKALVVGSLLTFTVGCSQQPETAKAPGIAKIKTSLDRFNDETIPQPSRGGEAAALSCTEIWAGFIAANPAGLSKTYEATTVTEYQGGEGLPAPETVVETSSDTVVTSTDESVTITYEYSSSAVPTPETQTQTLTKAEFIANCEAPAPVAPTGNEVPAPAAQPTVEVVAEGTGKLAVRAGEFDTEWVQGKITQTGEASFVADVQEWYLTGSNLLIKSTFDQTQDFGSGISVKTSQTIELIKYEMPTPAA